MASVVNSIKQLRNDTSSTQTLSGSRREGNLSQLFSLTMLPKAFYKQREVQERFLIKTLAKSFKS